MFKQKRLRIFFYQCKNSIIESLRFTLKSSGHTVTVLPTFSQLKSKIETTIAQKKFSSLPQLILVDINEAGVEGTETMAQWLRDHSKGGKILLIGDPPSKEVSTRLNKLGVVGVLKAPFTISRFQAVLESISGKTGTRGQSKKTTVKKSSLLSFRLELVRGIGKILDEKPFADNPKTKGTSGFILDLFNQSEGKSVLPYLNKIHKYDVRLLNHSLIAGTWSCAIRNMLDFSDKKEMNIFIAGAFIHDVGVTSIDPEVYEKYPLQLDSKNHDMWLTHPTKGRKMLLQSDGLCEEMPGIDKIVEQHHEIASGRGYPKGLEKKQISKTAGYFSPISDFIDLLYDAKPQSPVPAKDPQQAIESFKYLRSHLFDTTVVNALEEIIIQ